MQAVGQPTGKWWTGIVKGAAVSVHFALAPCHFRLWQHIIAAPAAADEQFAAVRVFPFAAVIGQQGSGHFFNE